MDFLENQVKRRPKYVFYECVWTQKNIHNKTNERKNERTSVRIKTTYHWTKNNEKTKQRRRKHGNVENIRAMLWRRNGFMFDADAATDAADAANAGM